MNRGARAWCANCFRHAAVRTFTILLATALAGCGSNELAPDAGTGVSDTSEPDAAAACPRVRVTVPAGSSLNIRKTPSTSAAIVGSLPRNAIVTVAARVAGDVVSETPDWFQIDSEIDGFISGAFASCTADEAPVLALPDAYRLPLECGRSARISQGNDGGTSHQGKAFYAFDFAIPVDTPLVAMADGIVLYTFAETGPGDPCYGGGGASCFPYANYVVLEHGDHTGSIYKHLNKVLATVGEFVPSGAPVGLSGSTGYSTGPHAHVMRQKICGAATSCQSIEVSFADVPGNGIPKANQTVTSANGHCE